MDQGPRTKDGPRTKHRPSTTAQRPRTVKEAGSTFDVLQAYLLARASFTKEQLAFIKSMFIAKRLCVAKR